MTVATDSPEGSTDTNVISPERAPDAALTSVAPAPVTGIIRGLAETLGQGDTLSLLITKIEDEQLSVVITPHKSKTEKGETLRQLQVVGTPAEIDEQLVEALAHYVPARKFAVKTAADIAAETVAAATKAKADAAARKSTATPAKQFGMLKIELSPKTATVELRDSKDNAVTVNLKGTTRLEVGAYVLTVKAENLKPVEQAVHISANKTETVTIALEPETLRLI